MRSALFTTNMQTSDCLAIIQPECTELNQRKLLVRNNGKQNHCKYQVLQRTKRSCYLSSSGTGKWMRQKQNNLCPNKLVACSLVIPKFRNKTNSKILQMLRLAKVRESGFKTHWQTLGARERLQQFAARLTKAGKQGTGWTKLRDTGQEIVGCRLSMKPIAVLIIWFYALQTETDIKTTFLIYRKWFWDSEVKFYMVYWIYLSLPQVFVAGNRTGCMQFLSCSHLAVLSEAAYLVVLLI